MGAQTDFYGKLKFTQRLEHHELAWLEWVIAADLNYGTLTRSDYMKEFKTSGRAWDNKMDNERPFELCDVAMRADGFVMLEGSGSAGDMRISDKEDGLVYASEKTYDLVAGINYIIANARRCVPDFGLRGALYAETDYEPYTWLLKINDQGWAEQVPCHLDELPLEDQKMYQVEIKRRWVGWSQLCVQMHFEERHKLLAAGVRRYFRMKYADDGVDPRNCFQKAGDAVCFGIVYGVSRSLGRLSYEVDHLRNG
jgi:hypothetical protein